MLPAVIHLIIYDWNDNYKTYHYFKYELIKWRVLNRNGNDALLLADVALDDQKYNTNYEDVIWETSSMRSWLNGYGASVNQPKTDYSRKNFINSAFTSTQRNAIKTTNVVNNNNINYGTAGGKNTSDKVFLLSESEVYNTDTAAGYGFIKDYSTYDEAREADAVPMHMRWVQGEIMIRIQSIQNTMEILIGGSARRATMAMMRPK